MMYAMMVLLSFLAAYGAVQLMCHWMVAFRIRDGATPVCRHTVLGVRDGEQWIEGMVRTMTWGDCPEEIIVLDFGSEDHTSEILAHLSLKYPCIHVMHPEEYVAFLRCLRERQC
ncbi:MAG: hypothetical protein IKW60_03935 [Clostridia bacterium]|nr:hypothetical protein [Clostridia bacterium]